MREIEQESNGKEGNRAYYYYYYFFFQCFSFARANAPAAYTEPCSTLSVQCIGHHHITANSKYQLMRVVVANSVHQIRYPEHTNRRRFRLCAGGSWYKFIDVE